MCSLLLTSTLVKSDPKILILLHNPIWIQCPSLHKYYLLQKCSKVTQNHHIFFLFWTYYFSVHQFCQCCRIRRTGAPRSRERAETIEDFRRSEIFFTYYIKYYFLIETNFQSSLSKKLPRFRKNILTSLKRFPIISQIFDNLKETFLYTSFWDHEVVGMWRH